jgi:hypothetical protein
VAVLLLLHVRADVDDLALHRGGVGRLQCVERIERHHLGGEATGRRAGGVAQRGDGEVLRVGRDDGGVLAAALPQRVAHLLGVDLVEAHGLELRDGPVDAALVGGAAGEALAHLGGEAADELVARVVGHGLVAQRGGGFHGPGGDRGGLLGGERGAGKGDARGERVETKSRTHGDPRGRKDPIMDPWARPGA